MLFLSFKLARQSEKNQFVSQISKVKNKCSFLSYSNQQGRKKNVPCFFFSKLVRQTEQMHFFSLIQISMVTRKKSNQQGRKNLLLKLTRQKEKIHSFFLIQISKVENMYFSFELARQKEKIHFLFLIQISMVEKKTFKLRKIHFSQISKVERKNALFLSHSNQQGRFFSQISNVIKNTLFYQGEQNKCIFLKLAR